MTERDDPTLRHRRAYLRHREKVKFRRVGVPGLVALGGQVQFPSGVLFQPVPGLAFAWLW